MKLTKRKIKIIAKAYLAVSLTHLWVESDRFSNKDFYYEIEDEIKKQGLRLSHFLEKEIKVKIDELPLNFDDLIKFFLEQ